MARSKTKNKPSYGVLFWIASILLISILYIANHQNIQNVLNNTRFMEIVFEERSDENTPIESDVSDSPITTPQAEAQPSGEEFSEVPDATDEVAEDSTGPVEAESDLVVEVSDEKPDDQPARKLTVSTYFIRVSDDGRIIPEDVQRSLEYTDSPLTRTIESLIGGPNADALNRGLLNLIPEGTELVSAYVEGGVAYLNFNEQFRFNPIGMEGFTAQLQQIVYTATAFSSIHSVQILIDGEVLDYLGGEGIYIGSPLTRDSFRA